MYIDMYVSTNDNKKLILLYVNVNNGKCVSVELK